MYIYLLFSLSVFIGVTNNNTIVSLLPLLQPTFDKIMQIVKKCPRYSYGLNAATTAVAEGTFVSKKTRRDLKPVLLEQHGPQKSVFHHSKKTFTIKIGDEGKSNFHVIGMHCRNRVNRGISALYFHST